MSSPEEPGADSVAGLARGGALNLAGTALSQVAGFAVIAAVAWQLGADGVGLYSQAYAFLALLELLALSGFRSALTRFVAVHRADGDDAALLGTLRLGLGTSLAAAVVLGAALFAAAPWLATAAFDDPELEPLLRLAAACLVPTVFMRAALSATQGYLTMRYYAGIGLIGVPVLRVVLTVGFLAAGAGLEGVMAALLVSEACGALASGWALRSLVPRITARARYALREVLGYSVVSWASNLASTGLLWASTLLLGLYLSSAEVGRYQVASRLVMFAAFAMPPINAAFAPQIAYLHRLDSRAELGRAYRAATSWILRLSLPAFVVLAVFPGELSSLFGSGFSVSWAVMALLVAGKLADSITGPCGIMLNQSGRVGLNLVDNLGVLVADVGLSLWLIPRYGLVGAALAWCASMVALNAARLAQVGTILGLWPFGRSTTGALGAGAAAFATAAAVQAATGGRPALAVGGALAVVAYGGTIAALGLGSDDRLALDVLLRRDRRRAAAPAPDGRKPHDLPRALPSRPRPCAPERTSSAPAGGAPADVAAGGR